MGIYKLGQKWYIDFYCDGRRVRKAVSKDRRDAVNALKAVEADILRGEFRFKREYKILFEDFAEEYLKYAKANKKSWLRDVMSLKHLKPCFKGKLLSKITPKDIEDYKRKRLKKAMSSTINREVALLKRMFNLAIKWKLADENPVKEVKFFMEQQKEMRILNNQEAIRLIEAAIDRIKPIIIVALNTGMRKGEILNLRWSDVDFDNHFIFIKTSKSGRMRKIPMSSLVEKTLRKIKRDNELVFYDPKTGNRITDIQYFFKRACKKAGIQDLRVHDLRHTAASWMVEAGIDLVTVKEILGHSKIDTTMRYAHPTPENKRRAVNALAAILGQKMDTIRSYEEIEKDINHSFQSN